MPLELEIKLTASALALRAVASLPIVVQHSLYPPVTRRLRSTYFDTPNRDLLRNAIGLRVRRNGRRSLQTVKIEDSSGAGLHQRHEWETPVPHGVLDFRPIDDPRVREVLAKVQKQQSLQSVFETDFRRTQRILRLGEDEIELCIDKGTIRAGDTCAPIAEIELELKAGDAGRLFEIAHALSEHLDVRLEARSKAERGYALLVDTNLAPRKATALTLAPDASAAAAFTAIVHACLVQLQANTNGALESDDPEFVHQARVALRRLRSACTLFNPLLNLQATSPVIAELRWLAAAMNDVRNWDVFLSETLPPIAAAARKQGAHDEGMHELLGAARAWQSTARETARAAFVSKRYQALLLSVGAWTVTTRWAEPNMHAVLDAPAADYARSVLARQHRRVRKRGKQLVRLGVEQRHALRIAAKKLRYASEFFAALFPKRAVQDYVAALAKLQDQLGALNDAATTEQLLDTLLAGQQQTAPELRTDAAAQREATQFVRGWIRATAFASERPLRRAWRNFKRGDAFW